MLLGSLVNFDESPASASAAPNYGTGLKMGRIGGRVGGVGVGKWVVGGGGGGLLAFK